jgi:hypothetical protein
VRPPHHEADAEHDRADEGPEDTERDLGVPGQLIDAGHVPLAHARRFDGEDVDHADREETKRHDACRRRECVGQPLGPDRPWPRRSSSP